MNVLKIILAIFFICSCSCSKGVSASNNAEDSLTDSITISKPSYRTISFYYNWYKTVDHDGECSHWGHPIMSSDGGTLGAISGVNGDIAANFYPSLRDYSSHDEEIIGKHMDMHLQACIGILSVTWWGMNDYSANTSVIKILDQAALKDIKVCFHIEPFTGRSAETVKENIRYIIDTYGSHESFYRDDNGKPLFFIYDSYNIAPSEWARVFSENGDLTVRNSEYDGVFIGLPLNMDDLYDIVDSHLDGLYNYFAVDGFTETSTTDNWSKIHAWARSNNKIFIPSVGPGYIDSRIRPWNGVNTRDREDGEYYDRMYQAAIDAQTYYISITSFNEWHEGTQIESSQPFKCANFEYLDFEPLEEDYYLTRTAYWVGQFENR